MELLRTPSYGVIYIFTVNKEVKSICNGNAYDVNRNTCAIYNYQLVRETKISKNEVREGPQLKK